METLAGVTLVGASHEDQVVGEPLEADGLVEHAGVGREQIGLLRVGEVHLELGADAGERAAELVGRVGHEPLLALRGSVHPLEHVVHGAGQARHLVVARRHRHPAVQITASDAGHLRTDRFDRAQRPTHQPPEQHGQHGDHERDRDDEGPDEGGDALLDVVGGGPDDGDQPDRLVDEHAEGAVLMGKVIDGLTSWGVRRHERPQTPDVGAGGEHLVGFANDLGEGIIVPQPSEHRRHGLALGADLLGALRERFVEGVGEQPPLLEDEPDPGHHEHDEHQEGGQGGDPRPDREMRDHGSTRR